jgi:hypothetical protein
MADEVESTPAKRGPGRPRKVQVEAQVEIQQPEEVLEAKKPDVPSDPDDPRIGQECDPSWSSVGFSGEGTYRCENGVIVEKVS